MSEVGKEYQAAIPSYFISRIANIQERD